jgi:hypothetical protein
MSGHTDKAQEVVSQSLPSAHSMKTTYSAYKAGYLASRHVDRPHKMLKASLNALQQW